MQITLALRLFLTLLNRPIRKKSLRLLFVLKVNSIDTKKTIWFHKKYLIFKNR